ncbi:BTB/POZ and MATH domain-containing protein 2-like [Lolium rigidum]|uniref:BTB/POZ and MATH domain-containing protein 2-like n=1 Tax=Lolium rigidum TaxID=89674 RepID=UPI001F5D7867|nr:BTB/POZ and MATH domain-containing protein 2-like [Lolium rigidum]
MADQHKVSTAIVAESEERSFVFKIHGYTRLKKLFKNGECVASPPFSAGGDNWVLKYYPNGRSAPRAALIFLLLHSVDGKNVNTEARSVRVLGKDGLPVTQYMGNTSQSTSIADLEFLLGCVSRPKTSYFGYHIDRVKLEQLGYIIDDCLSIKCDLTVKKDFHSEETVENQFAAVPPTDLHLHYRDLLDSMDGADVAFHVGGEKFLAHRIVLAARSSVFKAELLGTMKEKTDRPIEIGDMEPDVFKSLLHFIYTDSLPVLGLASNQGESRRDVVMAGHLLVAADRYNISRLKLICEHKLCSHIDANMVATNLALAEQHNCSGLKEACLQFLTSPSNLEAMKASEGYKHLKISCPSALRELIARLLPVDMKAAKEIIMEI